MTHLLIDLAKIGLIVICAAIFVSAFVGLGSYSPEYDDTYGPIPFDGPGYGEDDEL